MAKIDDLVKSRDTLSNDIESLLALLNAKRELHVKTNILIEGAVAESLDKISKAFPSLPHCDVSFMYDNRKRLIEVLSALDD